RLSAYERPVVFASRRRHTRCLSDWSSDVCSSDLGQKDDSLWRLDQVDGAERAPQVRLVEPPEAVVLLPGGEDVGPVERERARVLADGALVGEHTRRRAEVETSDAARIGIDDEDVAVERDREWTRAGGQRAGGCRGQRRTERSRGGEAAAHRVSGL